MRLSKYVAVSLAVVCSAWLSSSPSYAWEITRNFNSGAKSSVAQRTADGFDEGASNSVYTSEQVFEGGGAAKLTINAGEEGFGKWGGIINFPSSLQAGNELWFQTYIFVPTDFVVRTPSNGSLKFIRFRSETASGGNGGYIDIQIMDDSATQTNAFRMLHEMQSQWVPFGAPQSFTKGKWHRITSYVKFDTVPKASGGTGQVKVWMDGKLLSSGETIKTLGNSSDRFLSLYLFTYWNGNAPKTQSLFIDNLQMASTKPAWAADLDGGSAVAGSPPNAPILKVQ